jgi:hypothetical protein
MMRRTWAPGARDSGLSRGPTPNPVYPLGIEDGTLDWGDIQNDSSPPTEGAGVASAGLQALAFNLKSNVAYSGRAWPCTGFVDARNNSTACAQPAPLQTDKGEFFLYLPYQDIDPAGPYWGDSLSAGFFVATLGNSSPVPLLQSSVLAHAARPITYYGYTIADLRLGEHRYKGAQVYLWVDADAAATVPFNSGTSHGFMNTGGNAHVTIVSGGRSITADFDPGQIFVYFDVVHASVGFGSATGNSGYPLAIAANEDTDGLVENSSVGAVADIMQTPGDTKFYTGATANLVTDLTNRTALSGAASSCVDFDPATSICSNLTPIGLKTNRGNLYLFEPYTADHGAGPYSVNWGVFWSDRGSRRDD